MNPSILCGQMEMQVLQLAYVSILLCLFLAVEKQLTKAKKQENFFSSSKNNWLEFIKLKSLKLK